MNLLLSITNCKKFVLASALSLACFLLQAQNPIREAWSLLGDNKMNEAKAIFANHLNGAYADQAHLGLSYCYLEVGDNSKASEEWSMFCNITNISDPYFLALWTPEGKLKNNLPKFYEQLSKSNNTTFSAIGNFTLGVNNLYYHKTKAANEFLDKINCIKDWQFTGAFENISESGFDQNYPPIAHPEPTATFKDRKGAPTRWYDLENYPLRKWLLLENNFVTTNSIFYIQTFCESPTEQDVHLKFGNGGSIKIWINDGLVYKNDEETNSQIDYVTLPVKLHKGNNRILVQIGASKYRSANLLMRIANTNDQDITDLKFSKVYSSYTKDADAVKKTINTLIDDLKARIAKDPKNLLNYLCLAQYYSTNSDHFKSIEIYKSALDIWKNSAVVNSNLANEYEEVGLDVKAREHYSNARNVDTTSYRTLSFNFNEQLNENNTMEATQIFDKMVALNYMNEEKRISTELSLLIKKNENEALISKIYSGYKQFPQNSDFVMYKYLVEKKIKKNLKEAKETLTDYLEENLNSKITKTLLDEYKEENEWKKVIDHYNKMYEEDPSDPDPLYNLEQIYYQARDYDKALKLLTDVLKIAPNISATRSKMGDCYREKGNLDLAKKYYLEALQYDPLSYSTKIKLYNLVYKKDIFDDFGKTTVKDIIEKNKSTKFDEGTRAAYYLRENQTIVFPDGGAINKFHLLVKILNKDGLDDFKKVEFYSSNQEQKDIIKAEIITESGSNVDADVDYDAGQIVYSGLKVGDYVHLIYTTEYYYFNDLMNHFWDQSLVEIQNPQLTYRYSLIIPKNKNFTAEVHNKDLVPTKKDLGENWLYVWEKNNVAEIKDEPFMPSLCDVASYLDISTFKNWGEIATWYSRLANEKSKPTDVVNELAQKIIDPKTNLSKKEKIKAIYNYIVENIRYRSVPFLQSGFIPQSAARTITDLQGDCKDVSTLFVALCKTQNIKANLVLINTRNNGERELVLPNIGFNHCIAQVNDGDINRYYELTANNLPCGYLPTKLDGAEALEIVDKPNNNIFHIKNTLPFNARTITKSKMELYKDRIEVDMQMNNIGNEAADIRDDYENISASERIKGMQHNISGFFANAVIKKLEFKNLDNLDSSLVQTFQYSVDNPYNDLGGIYSTKILWGTDYDFSVLTSLAERQFPLDFSTNLNITCYEESLDIVPKEGIAISSKPNDVSIENPFFSYKLTATKTADKLHIERKFALYKRLIEVKDYPAFKEAISKVIKSEKQQIAFTIP